MLCAGACQHLWADPVLLVGAKQRLWACCWPVLLLLSEPDGIQRQRAEHMAGGASLGAAGSTEAALGGSCL